MIVAARHRAEPLMLSAAHESSQGRTRHVSAPPENVLIVPSRNVLLTRSGWEGGRTRSPHHEPAGTRLSGSAEKCTEEANHTTAGSRRAAAERTPGEAVVDRLREVGDRRLCMGCARGRRSGLRAEPDISNGHQPDISIWR